MRCWATLLVPCLIVLGCSRSEEVCTTTIPAKRFDAIDLQQLEQDVTAIDLYLAQQQIVTQPEAHGVRYRVTRVGDSEATPCLESEVYFTYRGRLMETGVTFDSAASPIHYRLENLILGWQLVLPRLTKGSDVTVFVPSEFAYGATVIRDNQGKVIIPSHANLIFEISLKDFR
ncbi:MAG: FKBP-type peptidyl-prolyl cis-trans isomerase [Cyclobacteriaceae bacterium]|nr:FKBP-type peptidyl-prolyl cis-trans isomerase [Cyclobacteriaceae bacterium]